MSSKHTAEKLATEVIDHTLSLLAETANATAAQLYKHVFKKQRQASIRRTAGIAEESKFRRKLYYLTNRGYIKRLSGRGASASFSITEAGLKRLDGLLFEPLNLNGRKWDGKWRVLTFDIPEENRAARDAIRALIKQLGFRQLHKSVWIHPIPCRQQITELQQAYGVRDHVTLLEVDSFDQEAKFLSVFAKQIIA